MMVAASMLWNVLRSARNSSRYGYWRLLVLSAVVGIVAGLGAIAFYWMLDAAKHLFMDGIAGYRPLGPGGEASVFEETTRVFRRWVLLVLPATGGVLSGFLVYRFAPEAEGHGTDAAIEAYHHGGGRVRVRVPFVKAVASALTIGSGGSGGREGPIAQIGAGFGSALAQWLRLGGRERRMLMAAGLAGGVGAIFHAPMAGALFAAEVLYRDLDLEYEVLIPSIISSIIAYSVFSLRFGWESLFVTPSFVFERPAQLLPYTILALAVAIGAIFYVKVFYCVRDAFKRLRVPAYWRPAIGGLVVGLIGFALPGALGTGYGTIQQALAHGTDLSVRFGAIGIGTLLAVFVGKILTTAFSIGSGGSGGVFGPAIVIGGALAGAVGIAMQQMFPVMDIQIGAFVMVGMAGFFAAAANTPISTIIMVSEMTGNYHLLVPSMWVCIIAYLLVRRHTLYEKQLRNRFEAPVHLGNMMQSVLKNITVKDVMDTGETPNVVTTNEREPLDMLLARVAEAKLSSCPVVNDRDELVGLIKGREIGSALAMRDSFGHAIIAEDLAGPPITVTPADDLMRALSRMHAQELEEISVVDARDPRRVVGLLTHKALVSAYYSQLMRRGE